MLVNFKLKSEQDRKTLIDCLNVMNIAWEEENSEVLNFVANTDPIQVVAMKLVHGTVKEIRNDPNLVHPISYLDEKGLQELVIDSANCIDYNNMINFSAIQDGINKALKDNTIGGSIDVNSKN